MSLEGNMDVFRNLFKGCEDVFVRSGTAGQAESRATSLYAGTNGTGNYETRKDINVQNA